jgi:hypothetical protein
MKYRIRHDFNKSQPRWHAGMIATFGERNEGIVVEADSPKRAVELFNAGQLPGQQLNPFYLAVEVLS